MQFDTCDSGADDGVHFFEHSVFADRPIRLASFNRHFSRQAGGAESYAVSLVESLARLRNRQGAPVFEVHVFSQTRHHHEPRVIYHKVPGPLRHPRWINQLVFAAYTWWKTRHKSSEHGFDLVHSHENTWHGQVQTVHVRPIRFHLLAGKTGVRRVMRWLKIAASPRLAFYVWLEAARMKTGAKRIHVATSPGLRQQICTAYPHIPSHLPVILPGVNLPTQKLNPMQARQQLGLPAAIDAQTPVILLVANDFARKGLSTALAGLARLKTQHQQAGQAHLVVVGQGAQRATFEALARQLGVAQQVHFLGAQQDMTRVYSAATLLLHPTLEDSFAMVVLEAMAHGLPVVVSSAKYCGISQFLQPNVDALILENPRDAAALAAAVEVILTQEVQRLALAQAGMRFAAAHSWQAVLEAHLTIYASILGSAMPPTTLLNPPST